MAACACGCGREAGIAKGSNSYLGTKKGNPNKYARGHNALTRPLLPKSEVRLCACGCRKPVTRYTRSRRSHGCVKGEFAKYLVGHVAKKSEAMFTIEWRGHTSACWIWQRVKQAGGYGVKGNVLAHRYFWQIVNGPVPDGLEIDHLCCNRDCVRPDHLEAVTKRENIVRAFARRRARRVQSA